MEINHYMYGALSLLIGVAIYKAYVKENRVTQEEADYLVLEKYLLEDSSLAKSKKPIIASIYPNSIIKRSDLLLITNIAGLMVNCCDFKTMLDFFKIVPNEFFAPKYFIGFYCNKIDEVSYRHSCTSKTRPKELENFKNDHEITRDEIAYFIKNYGEDAKILIGGCCGYGVEEMKILKTYLL